MADKKQKSNTGDGSSEGIGIFDDIFGEAIEADVPQAKKGPVPSPVSSAKAPAPKPAQKAEQGPAGAKVSQTKGAAPAAQPIKKGPAVKQGLEKKTGPGAESKPSSGDVELFDSIFSEDAGAAAKDTAKEKPPSVTPSVKPTTQATVKKTEQRPAPPKEVPIKKDVPPAPPKKVPAVEPERPKEETKQSITSTDKMAPPAVVKKVEQANVPPKAPPTQKAPESAQPEKGPPIESERAKEEKKSSATPAEKRPQPAAVERAEKMPETPKGPPIQKQMQPAQPIKKEIPVEPEKPPEKPLEKQSAPSPSVKTASPTVPPGKGVQTVVPPKAPPTVKKAEPPSQPIKKGVLVEPEKRKEKGPVSDSKNIAPSGDVELFDDIFSEGTDSYLPESRKGQPPSPAPRPKPPISRPVVNVENVPESPKGPSILTPPPGTVADQDIHVEAGTYVGKMSGKYKEPEEPGKGFQEKAGRKVNPIIFISSIIVLVILSMMAGRVINYDGIIKYVKDKTRSQIESDKKAPIPANKSQNMRVTKSTEGESKMPDSKLQATVTPKEEPSPLINSASPEKAPPLQAIGEVVPEKANDKEDKSPVSTKPLVSEGVASGDVNLLNGKSQSYPYSIYLGSYNSIEGVKEAVSNYEEMGLLPYWVRMDLGEKGMWYRLYSNYFQTRKEADTFIKTKQIPDAESKITNYVNLAGVYTSQEEAYKQKEVIEKLGYCPYVLKDNENLFRLYVGAFYQKDLAEEQNSELLRKGIQSRVVER